ncbi:MAG: hypothetical protein M3513_12525 [Actinomycetota bacterium]|nr:hypothetical protein [Actinomycetota bacterium]
MFGHVKGEWPHLDKIRDPADLAAELDRVRHEYNPCACTPTSATSPPTTNTTAAATPSGGPAATAWPPPARQARIAHRRISRCARSRASPTSRRARHGRSRHRDQQPAAVPRGHPRGGRGGRLRARQR